MELRHRRTHRALRAAARRYFTAEELTAVETVNGELVVHDARFRLGGDGLVVAGPPGDERFRTKLWRIDDGERATQEAVRFLRTRRLVPREEVERLADALVAGYEPRALLDIGCATGELVRALERREVGGAAGIDPCDWAVERRVTPAVKQGNALELPFRDRNFDVVFARDLLDHVEPGDLPLALAEQARVTRPGGHVVLGVHGARPWWHDAVAATGALVLMREPTDGRDALAPYVVLARG